MKKVLYGTTALVAAGMFVTDAAAADKIKMGINGSMQQWLGFTSPEKDGNRTYNTVGINTDTIVQFNGNTKLDNGWTVTATIDLDTANNNAGPTATVNQEYLVVGTDFGAIQAGYAKPTNTNIEVAAPEVGMGFGDAPRWAPQPIGGVWGTGSGSRSTSFSDVMTNATAAMAGYTTPTFGGFQATTSIMPGLRTTTRTDSNGGDALQEAWTAGAAYGADLGGVKAKAYAGYAMEGGARTTQAQNLWNAGLELGFGSIKVGGSFLNLNKQDTGTTKGDRDIWNVGVQFDIDAWKLSGGYQLETRDPTTANDDEEMGVMMASARYNFGGGLDWRTSVFNIDFKEKNSAADNNNTNTTGVVTGLNLAF